MKQILSGIFFIAAFITGLSNSAFAQVPSVVVTPIPNTCSGTNTILHYSATSSPTSYSITWYGSPVGIPNVAPGTALPASIIPIVVMNTATAGTYYGDITISNAYGASAP